MFENIGENLSAMISIPTVSGAGNEPFYHIEEYRDYLRTTFQTLFTAADITPVGEALLLKLRGTGSRLLHEEKTPGIPLPVLFTGHMDVVPAADEASWKFPPFSGRIADGCVWGRGSQDMKGPQCALLSAFESLLEEGWCPKRDIWLYLSCDEETGGFTTGRAAKLLKDKKIHFETVFDEGGTICDDFMGLVKGKAALFGIAEKGSLEYRFTALSRGGHSANPPAHSAIVRLADFIHEVEYADFFRKELSEGNRAMLRAAAGYSPDTIRDKLLQAADEQGDYPVLHEICKDADTLLGATIAFTMIEGGTAFNVMPKKAVLTANVRVSCTEKAEEITEKLKKAAERHDLLCELAGGRDAAPESSTGAPGYLAMKASVEETYPGLPVIPFVLGGGTDSRHFLELTDNVLRFSPMYALPEQGRGVHGDNEYASIQAVKDAAQCYSVLLKNYSMPEVRACGQEVHMDKIIRLQQAMPSDMEAAILQDAANRFYLTGMKSSAGTVLVTRNKAWLIIDFRYFEEAEEKVKNCRVIEEKNLYSQIKQLLEAEGISALSLHTGLVTLEKYRQLETALKGISLDVSDSLSGLMDSLRREKDEEEIACHKKAQQITDHTFSHILGIIKPGLTEIDVAREIGVTLTRLGSDDKNFNFIVASGPNSSLPHGFATSRLIQKGDFVTMDFGAVCGGYLADMTRTVAVGSVSEEQRHVYETVREAQKRAFDKIRPGAACSEVDAAARKFIYQEGYEGCFSHGLGHSVGVEVHENPRFNEVCNDRLVPGIVITVEPGIYLKKRFGVRIEDMIVVRENGFENLTRSPKELIIL